MRQELLWRAHAPAAVVAMQAECSRSNFGALTRQPRWWPEVIASRGVSLRQAGCGHQAAAEQQRFGVPVTRFRSCLPGARHQDRFTRAYRPQTNGKAERFIQSALREWAYGWTYQNSSHRTAALASSQHHCNWHRPHSGIGGCTHMPSSVAWSLQDPSQSSPRI